MKRGHEETWDPPLPLPPPISSSNSSGEGPSMADGNSKGKMMQDDGNNMDELLAVLGYKVRSSEMAEVAQKLEQLEMVLSNDDVGSTLLNDTVHYNPSDLSNWVENMLSELNNPVPSDLDPTRDRSEYDLSAIPGRSAFKTEQETEEEEASSSKRIRLGSWSDPLPGPEPESTTRSVVLVDSQETGVRLVHMLVACAEAIQRQDLNLADALVKRVGTLAATQAGAMGKVATYFSQALARRIYRCTEETTTVSDTLESVLQMYFYESCPYLKFAHFTANQAILEAVTTARRVHVIDFGVNQGMQWPSLMQALAVRPGGPPSFRLTGIGPPQTDDNNSNSDSLQQLGWKLAQFAQAIGVEFEFKGLATECLSDLEPEMFETRPESETLVINSVLEFHRVLAKPGLIDKLFRTVKVVKPSIVTVVEQEANHNGVMFLDRFNEALHYYSSLFDSLEDSFISQDRVMSEVYLGRQILNIVAAEGSERVERHETLSQWKIRFGTNGFVPVSLGSDAFKQASMLLSLFGGGDGYRVEENDGCLMLGWQTRPLITTSAWKLAGAT